MRIAILLLALVLLTPVSRAEASPMEQSFEGNPIVVINLTYESGTAGGKSFGGEIVLELFMNWAPITVTNFVNFMKFGVFMHIFLIIVAYFEYFLFFLRFF